MKPILEVQNISKNFPGIKALDGVSMTIRPGEVHALIGENGAGKSTLVKILTGVYIPTAGSLLLDGQPVEFRDADASRKAGIAAIHQEASMFPELTVTENIFMGHHLQKGKLNRIDWNSMKARTSALLRKMELDISPDTLVKNLGVAERHMVEIAKALSVEARIVIMDEPTSALTMREVEDLYKIVAQLKSEGKAIVFISHKFDEIFSVCDYFTVLRDGRYIGEGTVSETSVDEIIRMMVGRSLDQLFPKTDAVIGEPVMEACGLTRAGYFKDISFKLHRGEILGFFGLVGAGRSEVMRSIFGIDQRDRGELLLHGRAVQIGTPKKAMKHGLAYVPEDRQLQGIILQMSLSKNITLPQIDSLTRLGLLSGRREDAVTEEYGRKMEIKAAGWHVEAETLSGGNQQKVVLAKWLATKPEILILDEPTKGIDVATKAAVHSFISSLAAAGMAVILISSELPEVMGMSDRIAVLYEGRITAVFSREDADADEIMKAATGEAAARRHEAAVQTTGVLS